MSVTAATLALVTVEEEEEMELVNVSLSDRLRAAAATRGEELLAEFPATLRRLGLLFAVLAVSVPAFLAACVGVLAWWLIA